MDTGFDYWEAFSRNLGWVTTAEQAVLRRSRVAIGGLGGVGGSHLLTLTRLGVGAFHIADFDVFEPANFNRQAGAYLSSLGRPKVDVLTELALDINPDLRLTRFPEGITDQSLAAFLEQVDLYVDGLDFFAFEARRKVFAACARLRIPAVTVAPLGMSAALLNFLPGGMNFEDYFGLRDCPEEEQGLRFFVGLAPARLHSLYLVDPTSIDFRSRRGPSTRMGCELCAGIAATEALKILLKRGRVWPAPHGFQFDAYGNRLAHTWRPGGHRNPLQQWALRKARRLFLSLHPKRAETELAAGPVARVLDMARWAPSGDNTQPWRFEILGEHRFAVHGHGLQKDGVYDLDGRSGRMGLGALLENLAIAAAEFGFQAEFQRREAPQEPVIDVVLTEDSAAGLSPLFPYISARSTQRRPLSTRRLTPDAKWQMEEAAGPGFRLLWKEGVKARLALANLLFRNSGLRLTLPEAYGVHKSIIQWNSRYSRDRIPDQALGLDPLTRRLMRWTLKSWERARFFSGLPGGTLVPRIELDWLPALFCGAHFALLADTAPQGPDDDIEAGRAMQRVWLTATRLGLQMQPEQTPLIFARYVREGRRFTVDDQALKAAQRLTRDFALWLAPEPIEQVVFFGRIGHGRAPEARSLRLSVEELLWRASQ
jgi:molybdopterin/thiamine biosynthesis adenylyltransferase/nitroreductase